MATSLPNIRSNPVPTQTRVLPTGTQTPSGTGIATPPRTSTSSPSGLLAGMQSRRGSIGGNESPSLPPRIPLHSKPSLTSLPQTASQIKFDAPPVPMQTQRTKLSSNIQNIFNSAENLTSQTAFSSVSSIKQSREQIGALKEQIQAAKQEFKQLQLSPQLSKTDKQQIYAQFDQAIQTASSKLDQAHNNAMQTYERDNHNFGQNFAAQLQQLNGGQPLLPPDGQGQMQGITPIVIGQNPALAQRVTQLLNGAPPHIQNAINQQWQNYQEKNKQNMAIGKELLWAKNSVVNQNWTMGLTSMQQAAQTLASNLTGGIKGLFGFAR